MTIIEQIKKIHNTSAALASLSTETKNKILESIIHELQEKKELIFKKNEIDVQQAIKKNKTAAFIDRLRITDKTFSSMIDQLKQISNQSDPIDEILEKRILENGVELKKIRVPIGVIAIIYESRPNVTIDAAALCIKSGNSVILRGGSDAIQSNKILITCIENALTTHKIPKEIILFVENTDRKIVNQLLKQSKYIDLIIPRGGYDLVKTVIRQSRIPVLYHASGGARIYIDKSADLQKALDICINAKTNRPGTCNSLDTIIVHQKIAKTFLPILWNVAKKYNIELRGDKLVSKIISVNQIQTKDYETEYLDLILSIKIVSDEKRALAFIKKYSKGHTEGIVAHDKSVIDLFIKEINAATLCINCSTRLHDGGVFQLGAEMGIATGKLHARGPVGLKELTTYKWIATGDGQLRM